MPSVTCYWHTLRHLRPVQIYGRLWFNLHSPAPDKRPAPPLRLMSGCWKPTARHPALMTAPRAFRFLNQTGELRKPTDWNDPAKKKLWLYNLHYFDDLNSQDADVRQAWHRDLIALWINDNHPAHGAGWEPYPLSLRIVNWIKWALAGNKLNSATLHSLAIQVRFLNKRLEWHLLGNHLLANAKALLFAGLYFEGPQADEWTNKGLAIFARELPEQILPDGGHFELSPMYHSIILKDILDLINLSRAFPGVVPDASLKSWVATTAKMRGWLLAMLHPDNQISFFNDSAFNIASCPGDIEAYAIQLDLPSCERQQNEITHLVNSGYVRIQNNNAVAILDVARLGPDYLPGHAHADTLSFELSLFGQRVLLNSGTSVYGTGTDRIRQRSTSAHNTVEIDGKNSSETWRGFRVARRAHPYNLEIKEHENTKTILCAHDGYQRLPGQVHHHRQWHIKKTSLSVQDTISGNHQTSIARFHLHPDVCAKAEGTQGVLILPQGQRIRWTIINGNARIKPTTWHPEFGLSIPNQCLEITFTATRSTTTFSW